jgi:hypothetical protein
VAKPSERSWMRRGLLGAVLVCLAASAQAASNGVIYKPPVKGLVITYGELGPDKTQPGQASVTQKITSVKGDEATFTEWVKAGGLVISQKHRRLRSLFSFLIEQHNGILLHDFDKAALRRLWPLVSGKRVDVTSTLYIGPEKTVAAAKAKLRQGRKVVYRYTVEEAQSAKLPAGTFRTFVIQRTWQSQNADGSVAEAGIDRVWLATDIGWIVRLERKITAGPRKGTLRRLVAVRVKRPK